VGTRSDGVEMTDAADRAPTLPDASVGDAWVDAGAGGTGMSETGGLDPATGWIQSTSDESTPAEPDADAQAELLAAEIERTRGEMGSTLEEVGQRLDPARLADRARETVREATVGRIEDMVDHATTSAQETGNQLVRTIRENPVPAAMAGVGLWMLWQRLNASSSRGNGTRYASYGAYAPGGSYTSGSGGTGSDITARAQQAATGVATTVQQTAGDVATTVQQTAGDVADRASQAVTTAGATAGDVASQVGWQARRTQDQVGRAIQQNPLGAALAAVAVGAAVGMAIPTTPQERQVLGPATSTLAERAAETLEHASDQIQQQVDGGTASA
jgi:hypothetical protein